MWSQNRSSFASSSLTQYSAIFDKNSGKHLNKSSSDIGTIARASCIHNKKASASLPRFPEKCRFHFLIKLYASAVDKCRCLPYALRSSHARMRSSLADAPSRGSNGGTVSFRANAWLICSRLSLSLTSGFRSHVLCGGVHGNPAPRKRLSLVGVDSPVPDGNCVFAPDGTISALPTGSMASTPGLKVGQSRVPCKDASSYRRRRALNTGKMP